MATADFLDRYFEPVTTVLTPQVAQKLVDLQPDAAIVARVQELADKCDAGKLSPEELDEYRTLVDAGSLVALLKAKARRFLKHQAS